MDSDYPTDSEETENSGSSTPPFRVGDHVTDRDEDEEKPMLVVGIPGFVAREYRIEGANKTVAELNPEYPAADEVIEVVFAQRTDTDLEGKKQYAYPSSRLELRNRIHPTEEDGTNSGGRQSLGGGQ